jgi:RND family efflux transporter MFP subunit
VNVFRHKKNILIAAAAALALALLWWVCHPNASASVTATATTAPAALTVSVVEPVHQDWPDAVQTNGSLAAWQEAVIGAETGSLRITELLADVGSVVKRGQLLARLADGSVTADVRKQEGAVVQARAVLEKAQADLKRSRMAADSGALSSQQMDEYRITEASDRAALDSAEADLQSKRITLAQTRVLAVDDGVISSRSALLGNVVSTGTELFRLVRQGRIEWQAELDAQQIARVQIGQSAYVKLPDGKIVSGTVRLVAPTLSTNTGRAIVYVSLAAGSGAQAGMFASGSIKLAETPALTLPESALVLRDGRSDVYILNADGVKVTRRTVVTGRRMNGCVEVVSGLDAKVHVVMSGAAFLSDGTSVKVIKAAAQSRETT